MYAGDECINLFFIVIYIQRGQMFTFGCIHWIKFCIVKLLNLPVKLFFSFFFTIINALVSSIPFGDGEQHKPSKWTVYVTIFTYEWIDISLIIFNENEKVKSCSYKIIVNLSIDSLPKKKKKKSFHLSFI